MKDNSMPEKNSPFQFPDWAYLPPGVVQLISEKVKSIADYVRFRAVCSPWRSASLPKPRHLPPQLPWLMLPYYPHPSRKDKDGGIRVLYDLWEGKMHRLHIPETINMMCCASSHGWLLLASSKGRKVFLLNPLNRARIQLPSISAAVKRLGNDSNGPRFDARDLFDLYCFGQSKMMLSADLTDPNCLITVFLSGRWVICCRVGDQYWTRVTRRWDEHLADVTYYDGRFYLLYEGAMDIINSNKPEERIVFTFDPEVQVDSMHLVEGKSGVHVIAFLPDRNIELYHFQEWSLKLMVTDTSNTAIFFGNSYLSPYLAVCSEDWDSLDGDSIYMAYKCYYRIDGQPSGLRYSIVCGDRDENMTEHIVHDVGKRRRIFETSPCMWFQPSLF